eukprot:symbB.v1.2.017026.t1/scaffold1285.1/size129168/5
MHCTFWSDVYKILQERLSLTTLKFTGFFGATSVKNLPFASPVEPLGRPSHSDDIISWPVAGGGGEEPEQMLKGLKSLEYQVSSLSDTQKSFEETLERLSSLPSTEDGT